MPDTPATTPIPNTMNVGSETKPGPLAFVLSKALDAHGRVELHAVGAAAVNQAVKAIATARGHQASSGWSVYCVPSFASTDLSDGHEHIRLVVYRTQTP